MWWCAAALVAVSNLVFFVSTNFGERLLYVPSLVASYVVAHWLFAVARTPPEASPAMVLRSPAVIAPVAVVLALGGGLSVKRTRDWRDQITLFGADGRTFPNSARLNSYFGNLLYFEGERLLRDPALGDAARADLEASRAHLRRSLEILDRFQDRHVALGMAEYQLGHCREALPILERGLAFPGQRDTAIEMMVDCYGRLGEPAEAIALYRRIDREGLPYPRAWFELGNDAAAHGDLDASIVYFSKFLAAQPRNVAARFNIASAYYKKGDYRPAIAEADQCASLEATPNVAASCLLLAADALAKLGDRDAADEHLLRARAKDPQHPWFRK